MTEVRKGVRGDILKKKNRGAVKGESLRERREKREEVDRIKWRWRRQAEGEWEVRERDRANGCTSERKRRKEIGGERGECRGNVAVLSPVTHTDVWGGKEEQEEDRGENRGAEKGKRTTFEEEAKKGRETSNTEGMIRR